MARRKEQKRHLQVERLEDRDTPSAARSPFYAGIVHAGAVMPPQAQAAEHSPVCFNAVVVTPEVGPATVTCLDGGFVTQGQATAKIAMNHNETLVRDRSRAAKRK